MNVITALHTHTGQRSERDHTDSSDDTVPPSRRHRQHTSPPREGEGESEEGEQRGEGGEQSQEGSGEESSGTSAADLHFAVGLPWYLMLHGRDHARRSQPQGRGRARGGGAQPRPQQNPQVPRFGVPLVIGFK